MQVSNVGSGWVWDPRQGRTEAMTNGAHDGATGLLDEPEDGGLEEVLASLAELDGIPDAFGHLADSWTASCR